MIYDTVHLFVLLLSLCLDKKCPGVKCPNCRPGFRVNVREDRIGCKTCSCRSLCEVQCFVCVRYSALFV